ncbi:MAG: hypothetical protein MZV64_63685 [Ignavibacteriales bacterium]|nr:hypothetical protein [Ignavibacteriales bacterium]
MTAASGKDSAPRLAFRTAAAMANFEGILFGDRGLVDAGREDAELRRDPGHELPAPGRSRGEDDVHAAYCTRIAARVRSQGGLSQAKSFAPQSVSTA